MLASPNGSTDWAERRMEDFLLSDAERPFSFDELALLADVMCRLSASAVDGKSTDAHFDASSESDHALVHPVSVIAELQQPPIFGQPSLQASNWCPFESSKPAGSCWLLYAYMHMQCIHLQHPVCRRRKYMIGLLIKQKGISFGVSLTRWR